MINQRKIFGAVFAVLLLIILNILEGPNTNTPKLERSATIPPSPTIQLATESAQLTPAALSRVVDGDTLEVLIDGTREKVRIIGIDTPEIVDPRRPVECFGKEASNYAKNFLAEGNSLLYLEADPTQSDTDRYGRLLRYVFTDSEGEHDFGKMLIENGYATEYTYRDPYKYQAEYKTAEQNAQEQKKGLWADDACAIPLPEPT